MALGIAQLKSELIESAVQLVHQRQPPERIRLAERCLRTLYQRLAAAEIAESTPEQLYGAALALLLFAGQREPGQARLRVYNPNIDQHGWQSRHTVIELVNDDMSFLVDSVTALLGQYGVGVRLVLHPVLALRRDPAGRLLELEPCGPDGADDPEGTIRESWIHLALDRQTSPELLEELHERLSAVLADVRAATNDFPQMQQRALTLASSLHTVPEGYDPLEAGEVVCLLGWLLEHHFTFLGYRHYHFADASTPGLLDATAGSGLGLLRADSTRLFEGSDDSQDLPPAVECLVLQPTLLRVTKADRLSTVHRPVAFDTIFIKALDQHGHPVGVHLFVGLFTSVAYRRMVQDVPVLRRKVSLAFERAQVVRHSHDGRRLAHILATYPRDELFQIDDDDLLRISLGILERQERQRLTLFLRRDPFGRFVSCQVFVARDRYDTRLRRQIARMLVSALAGEATAFAAEVSENPLARLTFVIRTHAGALAPLDERDLEAQLLAAIRTWSDRLRDALVETHGEELGLRLLARYADAFPASYTEAVPAEAAVSDIAHVEAALAGGGLGINLYRTLGAAQHQLRFKLYHGGAPVALSEMLPVIEHMDLRVVTELAAEIRLGGGAPPVWLHDFEATTRTGLPVDVAALKETFQDAVAAVWAGRMESDGFNRLVLRAGLSIRQVVLLRALARFLRQTQMPFSQDYVEATFAAHPEIARGLVALFEASHDPERHERAPERVEQHLTALGGALERVANLDEDRILRRFLNAVQAIRRTNYFQRDAAGQPKPWLSFKFLSTALDGLPLPRPLYEVFVYSPRMEGIHLRGGKVARGGIRWSDRREDFRTEILGLMKAQMVKNTVIVPVGSKGGFVIKRPPPASAGREALQAEAIECYRTLMRGLLDLTDSLDAAGQVVAPPRLVRLDDDDPYLVVAADKGTATFSDIANGVSRDYGFWLDDAFASGGSAGYDHKKMGITARGAWEGVKRHFRERGVDCQASDITVVGVGDMAGDVFGNALLLSRHLRLVGAFNHQHIFLDPDPDAAASHAERQRLFNLPRSTWADYDPALISPGGGVFERSAKTIPLSPAVQARLGLTVDHLPPAELIRALLRAPVDLLFFGGIGTFVKERAESHADAGDKANDALRVDAEELKAQVIGEGANLGMTQRARVAAARIGLSLNTDAIDNSAGVDTSDHEVNLKILLGDVEARGDLTRKQRDQLLSAMTDEVAALVLGDNYLQTQALSVAQASAADLLDQHGRFMRSLEKSGRLSRALERLPDDDELAARAQARTGLTRPELAVLLAYAKITLYDDLLASDLPDEPRLAGDLQRYFPQAVVERFAEAITRHRLRREIIATQIVNSLVNRVGPTFVQDLEERTGAKPAEVARAYTIAREVFDLPPLWRGIEALDGRVLAAVQLQMHQETSRLLDRTVAWFLTHLPHPLDVDASIARFRPGVAELAQALESVLGDQARTALEQRGAELTAHGVPATLAAALAALPELGAAPDIIRIAEATAQPVALVGRAYYHLGQHFGTEWLRRRALKIKVANHWQKQAVAAIVDDLNAHQRQLTTQILAGSTEAGLELAVSAWAAHHPGAVDRLNALLADLHVAPSVDLAMLAVANRQLRALVGG